jgi:DUF1009 family protein
MSERVVGLIAGGGRLPVLVAEGLRVAGARVCGVGLRGHYDDQLPARCDDFSIAGVFRIGRWIRVLRRHGVREAVVVGNVSKARMHDPLRVFRQMPDWRAVQIWYRRLRADRRNAAVLAAVADALADNGVTVVDSTTYVPDHLAQEGVMTASGLSDEQEADVSKGWQLLRRLVSLDIGQALAIRHRTVIAIESLEGTDAMIDRAGRLNGQGWTLLKGPSEDHDMRFDVPVIGTATIERLAGAGGGCVALRAGRVIMIDKPAIVAAADRAGIAIVGV